MRIVIALGSNALVRRGEPLEASIQRERVEEAARSIASIARTQHQVICSGGGGIPTVIDHRTGRRVGYKAVIDEDLSAVLLALEVGADRLMLLADVEVVLEGWGTPAARPINSTTPEELKAMSLATGSMAPKIEAACRFVQATGHRLPSARS
jgi:carbamate kinase